MTDELLTFAEACSGWGQSKTCEGAFQRLRDHESRDASSKVMADYTSWSIPVHHRLLQSWGICGISLGTAVAPPAHSCDKTLFKAVSRRPQHDGVDLDRIMGKQIWLPWNSVSRKNQFAELALVVHRHKRDA